MRIAIIVGSYPSAERKRRTDVILSYSGPGVEMGIVDVEPSPYLKGFGSDTVSPAVPAFVAGCRQAERDGYDAAIPLGVLDIGLEEGRNAVAIPIVGAFEASAHLACFLGRRIGVVAYSSDLLPTLQRLAKRYGIAEHICGYDHVGIALPELAAASARLEDLFCAGAGRLQSNHGVDVILCAGISLCPVHLNQSALEQRIGLPVVEALGAPIRIAQALVAQRLCRARPQTTRSDRDIH